MYTKTVKSKHGIIMHVLGLMQEINYSIYM